MPRQALHAKTLGFVHPTSGDLCVFDSENSLKIMNACNRKKWRQIFQKKQQSRGIDFCNSGIDFWFFKEGTHSF